MVVLPINIEPCEEGGYFAVCPILQGCHAEGETYGEAIDNITDVIKAHIKIKKNHKEILPVIKIKKSSDLNIQLPVPVEPIAVGQK